MIGFFENYNKNEVTTTKRIINTPNDIARKTFFYVQEAGYLKSLKPHLSSRKNLDSFLFLVVLSGSGTVTYNGTNYTLSQGDGVLIDCLEPYTHISNALAPWELLWVHFNGPSARGYYDYIVKNRGHRFHLSDLGHVADAIEELIRIHEKRLDDTDIRSSAIIVDLLTGCFAKSSDRESESALSYKLSQILQYIDEHFSEKFSLDDLAEQFSISKYYLAHEFKKTYDMTIVQYILNKKITHAKTLLRYSNLPIEEIGIQCGIGDASYFNKIFKKIEGMTASQYRKLW